MNPNGMEPLDDLGKARLDAMALSGTERFLAHVSARRGIHPEVIRSWNAGVFEGPAAVVAGLADGVGTLDQTIMLAQLGASGSQAA